MKILAWPKNMALNPYCSLIYGNLHDCGVDIDGYSLTNRLLRKYDLVHIHCLLKKYDLVHIHFPEWPLRRSLLGTLLRTIIFVSCIFIIRIRGAKVVWTVHNLKSHENIYPILGQFLTSYIADHADLYINMSKIGERAACSLHPVLKGKRTAVISHPHYRGVYPNDTSKRAARDVLGLPSSAKVILFLGQIRSYKNVQSLVDSFKKTDGQEYRLIIAGKTWGGYSDFLKRLCEDDERIVLNLQYIADERLQFFFNACDVVAIPYENIMNSGSAVLALSFDRPVLVPRKGSMPELKSLVGDEWVYLFDGALTPEVLRTAVDRAAAQFGKKAPLDSMAPAVIAEQHYECFSALLDCE